MLLFSVVCPLLLWAEKTREQNTCKSDLNRIMTERPNICYIFEKLSVQGCQIWHSHVSMPFNLAPAHSTRPHNAKKSSLRYHFSRNSWKFGSQKLLHQGHFSWRGNFFFFSLPSGPRGIFEPNSATCNTHKHPQRVVLPHFHERVDESPRQDENFGTFGLFLSFFVSELRPFKVKTNFSNVFLRPCSLIPLMHCS